MFDLSEVGRWLSMCKKCLTIPWSYVAVLIVDVTMVKIYSEGTLSLEFRTMLI